MQTIDKTFIVPDMKTLADTHSVQEALMNSPGVMDVTTSLDAQAVTVRLEDPQGEALVRKTLENSGYPAKE